MPFQPKPAPDTTLVLDVFGTLAYISRPHRAYSLLRESLGETGQGFAVEAMSAPMGIVELAGKRGRVDTQVLAGIERMLLDEVASIRLYPDTIAVLGELLSQGTRIVLGSNLALPFGAALEPLLEAVGPWMRLGEGEAGPALTAYSYDLGLVKPDPDYYQAIAEELGVAPAELFMIGDRQDEDFQAPSRAGWSCHLLQREKGFGLADAAIALGLLR